jgi:hypothetical protein
MPVRDGIVDAAGSSEALDRAQPALDSGVLLKALDESSPRLGACIQLGSDSPGALTCTPPGMRRSSATTAFSTTGTAACVLRVRRRADARGSRGSCARSPLPLRGGCPKKAPHCHKPSASGLASSPYVPFGAAACSSRSDVRYARYGASLIGTLGTVRRSPSPAADEFGLKPAAARRSRHDDQPMKDGDTVVGDVADRRLVAHLPSRHRTRIRSWVVAAANERPHGSTPRRATRTVVASLAPRRRRRTRGRRSPRWLPRR